MKGSIRKHVAKDGTVSWRVRIDIVDRESGERRQPQRTFRTKREAQLGLAHWLVEIEDATRTRRRAPPAAGPPRASASVLDPERVLEIPPGAHACLREIVETAEALDWHYRRAPYAQVGALLDHIAHCARAALEFLTPKERPAAHPVALRPDGLPWDYHVYRLLIDGAPFYVGQSSDVPRRIDKHINEAIGAAPRYSRRARAIRDALAEARPISYEIVASASTLREILRLEVEWIERTVADGHAVTNSGYADEDGAPRALSTRSRA